MIFAIQYWEYKNCDTIVTTKSKSYSKMTIMSTGGLVSRKNAGGGGYKSLHRWSSDARTQNFDLLNVKISILGLRLVSKRNTVQKLTVTN